ncbi:OmpA family protein [Metapseudomonas lalkuanensis]|uniref:OmpA family protein n=1 Tax=Metapseudomonas lalkuanensis TaxID=2604832 RepID=UPI0015B41C99|nr:OmpA family protein [Pseudomonas lalkuanensis]
MGNQLPRVAISLLLVSSFLSGCASTSSNGSAPLNQGNWPICSLIGGLAGGGLGSIESSAWAAGGAAAGAIVGGLICYVQDGDADGDGVFDRRDDCPNTPAGATVDSRGCPQRTYPQATTEAPPAPPQDEVIVLSDMGNVLFAFDSAELTSTAKEQLVAVANRLNGANLVGAKVIGHTDSVGSDQYNQGLSERRARSVADFLAGQGVPADKLSTEGRGESQPVADNETDAGRAQNRRVEIQVDR